MKAFFNAVLNLPKLGWVLVLGQGLTTALIMGGYFTSGDLVLNTQAIIEGEVWRLVTFVFLSPWHVSIWSLFWWMLLIIYTESLERTWGTLRLNAFLWVGYLATVLAAFLCWWLYPPSLRTYVVLPNVYWLSSLFLAFAIVNPRYELLLFFILPVQIKWIALLTVVYWAFICLTGSWMSRLSILGGVLNIGLFFHKEAWRSLQGKRRQISFASKQRNPSKPFHVCCVCQLSDVDDPQMSFVYRDGQAYCQKHYKK